MSIKFSSGTDNNEREREKERESRFRLLKHAKKSDRPEGVCCSVTINTKNKREIK